VMRCHPYLQEEITSAAMQGDEGLVRFDKALMGHLAYSIANIARALLYGLSGGWLAPSPVAGATSRYYKQIARFSAATSAMADVALLTLGGELKRKESMSGRFADAMAYLYLCSATLKRFEDDGRPKADLPLVDWVCQYSLFQVEQALDGVIRNFPVRLLAWKMRLWVLPLGRRCHLPDDQTQHLVAAMLLEPCASRDRLVHGIYVSESDEDITGRLHRAMTLLIRAEPIERKLRKLGQIHTPDLPYAQWLESLLRDNTINQQEADLLSEARQSIRQAIMVDDFPADEWSS